MPFKNYTGSLKRSDHVFWRGRTNSKNTTHIMKNLPGFGHPEGPFGKKTESEKYLKALYGGTLSKVLPHGCFYAAATEKCTGAPNHHSFCEEGHPLGMRVTPLAAGLLISNFKLS